MIGRRRLVVGVLTASLFIVSCGAPLAENRPTSSTSTPATAVVVTTIVVPATSTTMVAASTTKGISLLPDGWARAEVIEVIDGDTIDVRLEDGSEDTVRLIGTNSPENGECFAEEATRGLSTLIGDRPLILEPDMSDRDQYGRLLRYLWTTDDRFVNLITVERGWALARDYPPDTAHSAELRAAEERAMASGAGMWAADACGASTPADIRIEYIEYDASGNDNFNLNGEWVEILNADEAAVDLTGWVVKDESASHRYPFPRGFTLLPEARVRIYTGCGEDSAESVYWCATGSAVWNNDGDTAFLLDPDGNIVHSYSYG